MTEPQSTPDAGLPSALEADEEPSEDTLSDQVAKTDAALHAWRAESVKRRARYEEARARAEAEMFAQRRKVARFGAATFVAAALTMIGVGTAVHTWRTTADARAAEARVLAPRPPLARVAAPPGVVVVEEEVASTPLVSAPAPIDLQPGSVRLWTEAGHSWAAFATTERGPVRFRYLDGAGQPVLEPMGCRGPDPDGIRRCIAGRSRTRMTRAVAEGAAPGSWTVQACGGAGCADLGTFPVR